MRFPPLPGFRELYPEQMAVRRAIERAWHAASRAAGFEEIDGPTLEPLELYTAKSGEAIVGELYAFEDRGGRKVALRPEMTPTLARMVAARAAALPKPIKWYCVPVFFRYERPQRGRLREFVQWNADIVGAADPEADVEAIAVAIDALERLGLGAEDVVVRLSDRRAAARLLGSLGVPAEREREALAAIDRLGRDPSAETRLRELLGAEGWRALERWCERYPLERAPELGALLERARAWGLERYLEPDFRIVRGLDYYTGAVWEIHDRRGTLRAVAGGGRYDTLVRALGGPDLPALGFGMGDAVLAELLRDRGRLPERPPRVEAVVIPIGEAMRPHAIAVLRRLRARDVPCEMPYGTPRLGRALRAASQAGARRAILVGPEEWGRGCVRVRDLASGREEEIPLERL